MDIFAHGLWMGAAVGLARQRWRPTRPIIATSIFMAVLPDLVQFLPLLAWVVLGDGTLSALRAFAIALPGQEPAMPPLVAMLSHHLHCVMHSAVIASLVAALLWRQRRALWLPLLGWCSHIAIDVFTHSNDFYPVPVLYPFTERGFDGLAWNTPWFLLLNYVALVATYLWLWRTHHNRSTP